ncbi:MAG TPA: glycosyltransferase family 4 protein [Solirubrobacteraceae bacterium]|jgi:glycosyltransferase involved in cell wall biosynthesis
MTASTERHAPGTPAEQHSRERWRETMEQAQREALPEVSTVASCSAALGAGGLGRHLQELALTLEGRGQLKACICGSTPASELPPASRHRTAPSLATLMRVSRVPTSPGVRMRLLMAQFDAFAARRLPAAEHLIAFNCQALAQQRAARSARYDSISLVSANSHMARVIRQHEIARRRYPLEGSWATRMLERNRAEYDGADRIYVASRYIRESFLEEGVPNEKLVDFPLTPDPRYRPTHATEQADRFEIVYVGSLHVHKGVPLLVDAVRRLRGLDLSLRLVGGWGTPGMRRFIEAACAEDVRITAAPGDPLRHLTRASVCVHPAYEDGFAYAPAEALAAGVPVLVSEDTGMKDMIDHGRNGLILPTGDLDALTEALHAAYRGELGLNGR